MTDAPTPDPAEVAGVIAVLTKAQRVAVMRAVTTRGIAHRLLRAGLAITTAAHDGIGTVLTLSPLGLAVRHQLQKDQPDD